MGYLKDHKKLRLMFDIGRPSFDDRPFQRYDWQDYYIDAKEKIPPNMPEAKGFAVDISVFFGVDHGGNKVNCRSQIGVLIFMNKAPIYWHSKK